MDRTHRTTILAGLAVATSVALGACSSAATPAASPSPVTSPSPAASASPAASPSTAGTSPSPAASGPLMVASGMFHGVDGTASGTATLEHLADGSFAVVFEDFSTSSADGLHVVLVAATDVTKSSDVDPSAIVDLGPLTGTSGMQDYAVPSSADAMGLHTVVIWDEGMTHAVAAAPLGS